MYTCIYDLVITILRCAPTAIDLIPRFLWKVIHAITTFYSFYPPIRVFHRATFMWNTNGLKFPAASLRGTKKLVIRQLFRKLSHQVVLQLITASIREQSKPFFAQPSEFKHRLFICIKYCSMSHTTEAHERMGPCKSRSGQEC